MRLAVVNEIGGPYSGGGDAGLAVFMAHILDKGLAHSLPRTVTRR